MKETNFEGLVTPHLPDLRHYCLSLTHSKWDAEDLYQEALLKTFLYVRNTASERVTKSFLFSAARLLWIDGYRRKKDAAVYRIDRWTDIDYVEIRSIIEWLADRLSERNMEIWMLSEYYGFALQDIADRMEITVPAVKSSLYRTRELIRAQAQAETAETRPAKAKSPQRNRTVDRWVGAVLHKETYEAIS